MKASEFDTLFESEEGVAAYLDKSGIKRPGLEQRRITVDFPAWMVHQLDKEANRLGNCPAVHYQDVDLGKN
jgi:hypothetical protein